MPQSASPQFFPSVIGWCSLRVFPSIRTPIILGEGPTILQYDLILHLQQYCLKVRSCSEILALRMSTSFCVCGGGRIQHTTIYIWKYGRNKISKLGIFMFVSFSFFSSLPPFHCLLSSLLFPFSLLPSSLFPFSLIFSLLLPFFFFSYFLSHSILMRRDEQN